MKRVSAGKIFFISIVFMVCCIFCGCDVSTQKPDEQPEEKLDYFSDEMLKEWSKENKKKENEYVLNGGYYLHFKGVNYPVVFTEGSITQFDNMPDELFFVEMFELFKDENLEKRCAFRGEYNEEYGIFAYSWDGYILDGKRPKNGTVLYIDETLERRFKLKNVENAQTFGPDDTIPLEGAVSSLKCLESIGKRVPISDKDGILEEFNTVRKLYYKAKELGVPFNSKVGYTTPLTCPSIFETMLGDDGYSYSVSFTSSKSFNEEELQAKKRSLYTFVDIKKISFDNSIEFKVDYCNSKFENEIYLVLMSDKAVRDLEKSIEGYDYYSNVVRDNDGKVISFTRSGTSHKVFYGSIDEFNDYLLSIAPIDPVSKSGVSYFSSVKGGAYDFREWYLSYNGRVASSGYVGQDYDGIIYAMWDLYKEITLYGDTQKNTVAVCKNQTATLPIPQKGGYEFAGWYEAPDFSGEPIEKLTYEDTYTELYAKFDKVDHYTLTFEPYGGEELEDIIYSYGDTVSLPIVRKPYYIFEGWCTDEKCETTPMTEIDETFSGSYHLYPCFKARVYSILVVIDKSTTRTETVAYGEKYKLSIDGVKAGFIGYFDQLGEQYTDEYGNALKPFTDGMDIQLFAKYQT